jgi:hypothetical protein
LSYFIKQSTDNWLKYMHAEFGGKQLKKIHFQSNYRWRSMYKAKEIRSTAIYEIIHFNVTAATDKD